MTTHPQPHHGLTLTVHRGADPHCGDCSNNGISARHHTLTLIGPGIPPLSPVTPDAPAVLLSSHVPGLVRLIPVIQPDDKAGPMFGGNFAYTSDSRFHAQILAMTGTRFHGAVAIHDRFEQ